MDGLSMWIIGKLGPQVYGSILGFVLQVVIKRPGSVIEAVERAVAAVLLPLLLARPLAYAVLALAEKMGIEGLDETNMLVAVSGVLGLGGTELVKILRERVFQVASKSELKK